MRPSATRLLPATLLAAGVLACLAAPAAAQVSVDQGALDSLGNPAAPAPAARPAAPQHPARPAPRRDAAHASAKPKAAPPASARPPTIAPAAPPRAVLPPFEPTVPTRPSPPPPVPIVPDAPNTVSAIPGGTRVTFGAGRSDLNPAAVDALRSLARTAKADPAATLEIDAWAAGTPDDPSTPRRLSLARALAVRAVLISEGIASPRIHPRALGTDTSDTPDRAEVTRTMPAGTPPLTPADPAQPAPHPESSGKPVASSLTPAHAAPAQAAPAQAAPAQAAPAQAAPAGVAAPASKR